MQTYTESGKDPGEELVGKEGLRGGKLPTRENKVWRGQRGNEDS